MKIDKRILELFNRIAGDKAEAIMATATKVAQETSKQPERALADALEMYNLV